MGSVALDTGVLVAWLDADDAHHAQVLAVLAEARAAGHDFSFSAVTLAELLATRSTARKSQVRELVANLGERSVIEIGVEVAEIAGELRAKRPSLRIPDALIAASAIVSGAEELLTTDRALARVKPARFVGAARA